MQHEVACAYFLFYFALFSIVPPSSTVTNQLCSCVSPLWDADVRNAVKTTQMAQHKLNKEKAKLLVPGTELNLGRQESRIPVLLLHNPGVKGHKGKGQGGTLGYGAGWDLVLPSGWAMAFWIALIYRGARAGGIRESRSTAFQQGAPHFPEDFIDTVASRESAATLQKELEKTQSRKPPAKRPSYAKLGIPSPFSYQWVKLGHDWRKECDNKHTEAENVSKLSSDDELCILVVRDKGVLRELNKMLNGAEVPAGGSKMVKSKTELVERLKAKVSHKKVIGHKRAASGSQIHLESPVKKMRTELPGDRNEESANSDVTVDQHPESREDVEGQPRSNTIAQFGSLGLTDPRMYVCLQVSALNKGAPGPFSLICLPSLDDLSALAADPTYGGPVEPIHKEYMLPRKSKKKSDDTSSDRKMKGKIVTDKLGLPNLEDLNLVKFCTRKVIGYITNGVHAFSTGKGFGVGFCCVLGLRELIQGKDRRNRAVVLVRDTGSLQYRFAHVNIAV